MIFGSKIICADLKWLKKKFKNKIEKYWSRKGCVFGVCGGYQRFGKYINDPNGEKKEGLKLS